MNTHGEISVTLWAFVSDIHGNYPALLRAVGWCQRHGVDRYISLGDVIGRGDPDACVAWVRDNASIAIVGNRDFDYLDRVRPELQEVVRRWSNEGRAADFVVSHGDPKLHRQLNSSGVREGFRRAAAFMEQAGARLWLFGHTHNARVWRLSGDGARLLEETNIDLDATSRYVVNVGTTGLPLPGRGGAAIAVYDDAQARLEVVRASDWPAPNRPEPRRGAAILDSRARWAVMERDRLHDDVLRPRGDDGG